MNKKDWFNLITKSAFRTALYLMAIYYFYTAILRCGILFGSIIVAISYFVFDLTERYFSHKRKNGR